MMVGPLEAVVPVGASDIGCPLGAVVPVGTIGTG